MSVKHLRFLAVAATDRTFERATRGGDAVWVGKCIHCNRKLIIADTGAPISRATLEHIWPRNHGGGNAIENLAIACAGCNREKGGRHESEARAAPMPDHGVEHRNAQGPEHHRRQSKPDLRRRGVDQSPDGEIVQGEDVGIAEPYERLQQ